MNRQLTPYEDKPEHGAFYGLSVAEQAISGSEWKPFFVHLNQPGAPHICALWSVAKDRGFETPPKIGERVVITFNEFGAGTVRGYFVEAGFLGVEVECDKRPAWHIKQDKENKHPHPLVFGAEIRREDKGQAGQ